MIAYKHSNIASQGDELLKTKLLFLPPRHFIGHENKIALPAKIDRRNMVVLRLAGFPTVTEPTVSRLKPANHKLRLKLTP